MTETQDQPATPATAFPKPRIGLVCDFVEERWPSMDLVADMVFDCLNREHSAGLQVSRICPPLHQRFGRLPGIGPVARAP